MTRCESVICCRVSPKEKADVVRLVKNNLGKVTLAIGDGANDVNMIQEAHIGIGLYGQEGMRAVQSSDYALPEFRALWKLLLVHGRWSYIRISEMILYFFYKNMIFTIPQVAFCWYNAFSGQSLFDDWYITFYNLAFTSIPLVVRALFDQDVYYKKWSFPTGPGQNSDLVTTTNFVTKEYYSYLYYVGQQGLIFTIKNLLVWIFQGVLYGWLMFLVILYCLDDQSMNKDGQMIDLWYISITVYTAIILIVDIKLALHTKTWTWLNWVGILVFSVGIYVGFVFLGDKLPAFKSYNTVDSIKNSPLFYMLLAFFTILVVYIDYISLIAEKEFSTPMRIFFNSIIRREQDHDPKMFENLVNSQVKGDLRRPLLKRNNTMDDNSAPQRQQPPPAPAPAPTPAPAPQPAPQPQQMPPPQQQQHPGPNQGFQPDPTASQGWNGQAMGSPQGQQFQMPPAPSPQPVSSQYTQQGMTPAQPSGFYPNDPAYSNYSMPPQNNDPNRNQQTL